MKELDHAMIRATGAPSDFDHHYAAEVPAYGSVAMRPDANVARDQDRIGALAGVMEKFGASSGLNMTSYGGVYMPDQGTVLTTAMRIARHPFFSGPVSPNLVFGYQHGRTAESIVRMGVNASGIEFNFGKGYTRTNGFALGLGAGVNAYEMAGRKQRVGLVGEGTISGSHSAYKSVFLRVPRNSEAEGGVKGAGVGAASDSVRTACLASAMHRLNELLESGDPHPMLSLMAEFDALSVGVAHGENDFTDTTRYERSMKGTFSAGMGSVGGKKLNLAGTADLMAIRNAKLEQFKKARAGQRNPAQRSRDPGHAQDLLANDIHAHMEALVAMVHQREVMQGMSYRGMAEATSATHEKANELLAIAEPARQSTQTTDLAQAKERELEALRRQSDSYAHVDVGFRINTYRNSEINLAGVLYSGWKMDARTNADRAKI